MNQEFAYLNEDLNEEQQALAREAIAEGDDSTETSESSQSNQ